MQKKILLTSLNAKYVHSNLALKYLYIAGRDVCDGLEIREFTINNSRDYIFNELVMGDYDAVCFSCYIWNIEKTKELAADLKKAKPQVSILFGGPEVSYDSQEFMENHPFLDFLIYGEGEKVFANWCSQFQNDGDFSFVEGLCYRSGVVHKNIAEAPVDFGVLEFPYESFPCESDKVIYYEASRGCPFRCSYCISSLDRRIRELPIARVKDDLTFFLKRNVKQVKFLDRTFNWDRRRSLELFRFLIDHDNGVTNFHFEICADLMDDEMLQTLAEARSGLFQFEIGIQSTNEETLYAVGRNSNVQKVMGNVRKLVALGNSHIHVDLIAGLPYEDYATFRKSFNDVYGLGADNLQLGFLKLLKGTLIRERAEEFHYRYMETTPYQVICNDFISAMEICRLKQIEEVLDLYANRGGFGRSLAYAIEKFGQTPFDFYESFAEYFYQNGYQHRSHKKEDLYRIFNAFGQAYEFGQELTSCLEKDLEATMNFDAVKKFKRKGWEIQ